MNRRASVLVAAATLSIAALLLIDIYLHTRPVEPLLARPAAVPPPSVGMADFPVPKDVPPSDHVDTVMRNVDFHEDPTLVLHIHQLRGTMRDKEKGKPLNLDDRRSFVLEINHARIGISGSSLADLMNRYAFGYSGAPLRNLRVTIAGGQLRQQGLLHKGIDIPFTMDANVSLTNQGLIRVHPVRIQIFRLNGTRIMHFLGLTLQKVMDVSKASGIQVEQNDLIIDPLKVLPAPEIRGRLTDVRVEGGELLQTFGGQRELRRLVPFDSSASNYMYFQGGVLRMGKLFMVRADMQVIDLDPKDPFDFYIDRYNNQLVAGHSENQPNYALKVFMRDFDDLGTPRRNH